jgi:hypothetical protein
MVACHKRDPDHRCGFEPSFADVTSFSKEEMRELFAFSKIRKVPVCPTNKARTVVTVRFIPLQLSRDTRDTNQS